MKKRVFEASAAAVLVFFVAVANVGGSFKPNISIAILPCSDIIMSFKKYYPLIQHLEIRTGLKIKLEVPKNYEEFDRIIRNREADFFFQDPHTYVRLAHLYNKSRLIRSVTNSGESYQHGIIIVKKGSGITGIAQLKKKTVMFGPKLSTTKWIAAKEVFKKNGVDISKDLKAYQNGGCCEDIAFNVYLGAVDAGVVCEHFIKGHAEKQKELGINVNALSIIGKTDAVPTRIFAARAGVDDILISKINNALLNLDRNTPAHKSILFSAEVGGFRQAKDSDYDNIRSLMGMTR